MRQRRGRGGAKAGGFLETLLEKVKL